MINDASVVIKELTVHSVAEKSSANKEANRELTADA